MSIKIRSQSHTLRKLIDRCLVAIISVSLSSLPVASLGQTNAGEELVRAGNVVFVSGQVTARDASGGGRSLRRRSAVYVGDTLYTTAGASAQIRMTDLGGIFTGAQAEAFVGGFALLDANNPANFVEGLYTIER